MSVIVQRKLEMGTD